MRRFLCLAIFASSILSPGIVSARTSRLWSYNELTEAAHVIVIATPVAVQDAKPGVVADFPGLTGLKKPVLTTFKVLSVLKGEPDNENIVLDHFRRFENGPSEI